MAIAAPPRKDAATRRATDLLKKVALIDGHNDLPWVIRSRTKGDLAAYDLTRLHPEGDTDIPRLRAGQVKVQVLAAFLPSDIAHPATVTLEQIDLIRRLEARHAEDFHPIRRAADIGHGTRAGKIGTLITVEGTVGCEGSLAPLRVWYALGVRLVTLVHNHSLPWVDSSTDKPRCGGLSPFGVELVRELNRLGVIVDLSHCSEAAALAAAEASAAPVVLSHSNAAALCPHPRNASDAVIRRVAEAGGVIMVTFVPDFINAELWARLASMRRASWRNASDAELATLERAATQTGPLPKATLPQLCDHILYLLDIAGPDHIGIGSDFFGGDQPQGLEDCSTYPALFAELIRRGVADNVLARIAGANFMRVMRKVEKVGREMQKAEAPAKPSTRAPRRSRMPARLRANGAGRASPV